MVVSPELLEDVVKDFNKVEFPGFLRAEVRTYKSSRHAKTLYFTLPEGINVRAKPSY